MITAKGYAAQTAESPLAPWQLERRELGALDVQIEILFCGVCHTDIHLTRNEWFEDTYPSKTREQSIYLLNMKTNSVITLGSFVEPLEFKAGWRADIHCRWSPKGNYIGFNSTHTGSRQVYVMKVKE